MNASTWGEVRSPDGASLLVLIDAGRAVTVEIGAAQADLDRLDALLSDAAAKLLESFGELAELCGKRGDAAAALQRAATALQFQDLAAQLIAHTREQLGAGAWATAAKARSNPAYAHPTSAKQARQSVRQHNLEQGSIELF